MYQSTRHWVEENWNDSLTLRQWWQLMNDARLSFPRWPSAWFGQDATKEDQNEIARAFADAAVIGAPSGLGVLMGAPVTMTLGIGKP